MRAGDVARATNVTIRALRYYEAAGLIAPERGPNGYRDYSPEDLRHVREIRALMGLGLKVRETRPFLECLADGHAHSDECAASLAAYRAAIERLSEQIDALSDRRRALRQQLEAAALRLLPAAEQAAPDRPARAIEADDLLGARLPAMTLPASDGTEIDLVTLRRGLTVLFVYPLSGRPDVDLPLGWNTIPGARGCTAQACSFRDHHAELEDAGATRVLGMSSQPSGYQRELVDRLGLPFRLISDTGFRLGGALGLPTFTAGDRTLYRRLTLIVRAGRIEHVFSPVREPERHAEEVLAWLAGGGSVQQ